MKRTDLVQKLLETSSSFKKKPSDEPRSVLFEKAATIAAVEDLLLEILQSLNNGELKKFMKSLLLAFENDSIDIPHFLRDSEDRTVIVDRMMRTYGRQSVDKSREILKKLNRDDVMLMFPETSSAPKEKNSVDEHQPPKFETTVKEDLEHILLETLRGLKFKEFEKFKWLLQLTYFQRSLRQIQWNEMKLASTPEKLVHLMVMNREPVEVTREVLLDMNRTDLVERQLGTDSGFQEKHWSEEPQQLDRKTLHWKLWETLEGLKYEEHNLFKQHLLQIAGEKGLPRPPERQIQNAGRDGIVMLMVEIYGQQSVELTEDVLQIMNRTDLLKTLTETSSGFNTEERHRLKKQQNKSTKTSLHLTLWETLRGLSYEEHNLFKQQLLQIAEEKGLPRPSERQIQNAGRDGIVNLMVEIYGQQSVELTEDVLQIIKRTYVLKTLTETSSGFNTKKRHQPKKQQNKSTKTSLCLTLSRTLRGLSHEDHELFKQHLLHVAKQKGLPKAPKRQMKTADIDGLVELMVEIYDQKSVELAMDVLQIMNRTDLLKTLTETSSGFTTEGSSTTTNTSFNKHSGQNEGTL